MGAPVAPRGIEATVYVLLGGPMDGQVIAWPGETFVLERPRLPIPNAFGARRPADPIPGPAVVELERGVYRAIEGTANRMGWEGWQ